MKTKIIALLLAMVLVVFALASCGGGNKGGNQGGGDNPNPGPSNTTTSFPWTTTNLKFEMSENSNQQELPSTCKRYLAGNTEDVDDASTVDAMVAARNNKALTETNVTVEYDYLPDTTQYGWAQNIDRIHEEVSAKAAGRPDIYCNFVYDMVATSLKGSFANLLSTTMQSTINDKGEKVTGADHNYFEFTDPTYVDTGVGYMNEYMRTLTLSKHKMYCLSSDYFTDMVRAFLIVPVNIGLLETIDVAETEGQYNSDRTGDGEFTIDDFYKLVDDKEWNYSTLAQFSEKIFADGATGDEGVDLRDTVGFALGTNSGLPASGMLYTTSITIIEREYDAATGEYTYNYPGATTSDGGKTFQVTSVNEELVDFCDNLTALFNTKGVIAVGTHGTDTFGYGTTDLQAIRSRFSSNNVLFGGVICLGSLEYDQYKDMNGKGGSGYGIAPVPLYRTNYTDAQGNVKTDDYLTQIHNLGRIGAISYTTEKFAQCSAYLDYQSTHSTDILNEYYDFKLQYDVVGTGVKGNVEMLKYIRKNVRTAFDKVYEDAIGRFYNATDEESLNKQWHSMIKNNGYALSGDEMRAAYNANTGEKAKRLYDLEHNIFGALPA